MKGHFIGMFAQDKWKLNNNLTINFGARYDIEILPTPNQENPLFADDPDGYPMDLNNISPRLGFAWALDERGRSALRGGAGVFYQRTSYTFLTNMFSNGRFSDSFTVNFPTNNFDPGPRQGNFPTDPILVNGPVVNHALLDAQFPPGTRVRNGGTVRFDNPDRINPYSRTYSIGYERQVGAMMGISVDFIRSEQRNQYVLKELNPLVRNGTLATNPVTRTNPLVGTVGEWAASVRHARARRLDRLQQRPGLGHQALREQLAGAHVVRVLARPRQHCRPARPTRRTRSSSATSIWTTNTGRPPSIDRTS